MDHTSALIDQGWFRSLNSPEDWNRLLIFLDRLGDGKLRKEVRYNLQREAFNPKSKSTPGINQIYLLERTFEFERLLIDKEALEHRGEEIPVELKELIVPETADIKVYQRAGEAMRKELNNTPDILSSKLGKLDDWPKTRYFDRLWNNQSDLPASIAESDPHNDWIRAYFYLAFSESLGVTPLLSGPKARFVSEMALQTMQSQHELVREIFDKSYLKEWQKISSLGASSWDLMTYTTPPILEYVTATAIERDVSAYVVLRELRDSPAAKDYRLLLSDLRECFSGGRRGHAKAQKIVADLSKVAKSWATTLDVRTNVTHVPRVIKLRCIPVLGRLLDFAGMGEKEIKDRLLSKPPGYLVFCSSWYSDKFKFELGKTEETI